ncbi:MAG: leucyl aminopeptidase [Chloroflexi bacterium]|nr:leucyl aminopeptidase [Chloroflexota bacterium]
MEIKVIAGDITKQPVDAIIVNLFEGTERPTGATAAVDQALEGAISRLIAQREAKGKKGEVTIVHTMGKIEPLRVALAGMGKQAELTLDTIRGAMGEACRALRKTGAKRVATIVHGAGMGGIEPEEAAIAITEGSILGLYTFKRHKSKIENETEIEELTLVEREASKIRSLERGVARGKVLTDATALTRDLVNEPANYMTPTDMTNIAKKVAEENNIEIEVLEREHMSELGMNALLGVAKGSTQPPKFIILRYWGNRENPKKLGLVGKGITFDSGGISLKPAEGMGEMKGDMAGGASVIATLGAVAKLRLKINVVGLVPATENLPSGSAQKPGDVVVALNKKTIEVENTDAEGRLILADALAYGRKLGLSAMVDVATLTGAIRIALGTHCTGAFTNNQDLVDKVVRSGEKAGEKIWQMPLFEEYKEQIKSEVADIKNTGGRFAGSITGALFLAEFSEDTPWVHLDIAGTSTSTSEKGYTVKGATGVPTRTLINLALALTEEGAKQ